MQLKKRTSCATVSVREVVFYHVAANYDNTLFMFVFFSNLCKAFSFDKMPDKKNDF